MHMAVPSATSQRIAATASWVGHDHIIAVARTPVNG